jgi:glycosyltransferase involved in cell wall biosynthesis
MRILFLTQVLPYPLDAGPKTRAYYVLRHLANAGHEVTLLTFTRASDQPEFVEHLRTFCTEVHTVPIQRSRINDAWRLARSLLGSTPFLIARDWFPAMAAALRTVLHAHGPFDAIHADQLWMAPYALLARQIHAVNQRSQPHIDNSQQSGIENCQLTILNSQLSTPLLVLDQHNAVFQIPQRLAESETNPIKRALLRLEAAKLTRYEARTCTAFDRVVWVTDEDRAALAKKIVNCQLTIDNSHFTIPICVDPAATPVIPPIDNPFRVTFLGGLHWPPNAAGVRWFVEHVWSTVHAAAPHAILTLIGKDPPYPISNLQSPIPNLHVTGYVADPIPYLAETAVFIVPLHAGGGMRVKILDAWCWGLPIVSTTIGAEGIRVQDGENLLLADDAISLAQSVLSVLNTRQLAAQLRQNGRQTAVMMYNWHTVYRSWDEVY